MWNQCHWVKIKVSQALLALVLGKIRSHLFHLLVAADLSCLWWHHPISASIFTSPFMSLSNICLPLSYKNVLMAFRTTNNPGLSPIWKEICKKNTHLQSPFIQIKQHFCVPVFDLISPGPSPSLLHWHFVLIAEGKFPRWEYQEISLHFSFAVLGKHSYLWKTKKSNDYFQI